MALKTEQKPDVSTPVVPNTTVLELSLYTRYTWGGFTYEQGKPYRFKNADAIQLLGERDLDRPIWKMYKPPVKPSAPRQEIVDATNVEAPEQADDFGAAVVVTTTKTTKRIEIGDDSEIEDVLNKDGDVTV